MKSLSTLDNQNKVIAVPQGCLEQAAECTRLIGQSVLVSLVWNERATLAGDLPGYFLLEESMKVFFNSFMKKEAERLSLAKDLPVSPNQTRNGARSSNDLSLLMKKVNVNLICYICGCVLFCFVKMMLFRWEKKGVSPGKVPLPGPLTEKGHLLPPRLPPKGEREGWWPYSVKGFLRYGFLLIFLKIFICFVSSCCFPPTRNTGKM